MTRPEWADEVEAADALYDAQEEAAYMTKWEVIEGSLVNQPAPVIFRQGSQIMTAFGAALLLNELGDALADLADDHECHSSGGICDRDHAEMFAHVDAAIAKSRGQNAAL